MILPRRASAEARAREWRRQERLRLRLASAALPGLRAWQRAAGAAAVAALESGGDPAAAVRRTAPMLARVLAQASAASAQAGARDAAAAASMAGLRAGDRKSSAQSWEAKDDLLPLDGARVNRAAEQVARFATRRAGAIAQSLSDDISRAVLDASAAGEGQAGGAKRIRAATSGAIGQARAGRIARTETHGAAQAGALAEAEALREAGIEVRKVWLATSDPRTRESHRAVDGQSHAIDAPFLVGGHALRFPGDPEGPPGQVINCRCGMALEPVEDSQVAAPRARGNVPSMPSREEEPWPARTTPELPASLKEDQAKLEGRPALRLPASPPPDVRVGPMPDAPAVVIEDERRIMRRTRERVILYDADGKRVGDVEGTASQTQVPATLLRRADGFTHNHPQARSSTWFNTISQEDVGTARQYELTFVRAVTAHGIVYHIKRVRAWPDADMIKKYFKQEVTKALHPRSGVRFDEHESVAMHRMWIRFAEEGWVTYDIARHSP